MKCRSDYADDAKFRIYRNASKQRNYAKSVKNARNKRNPYSDEENKMILEHSISDNELSKIIGRSVKAIQLKRCRLLGHDAETERRKQRG